MDTDLTEIKTFLTGTKKHLLTKRLIALTLAFFLIGAGGWRPRGKETFSLSCRISAAQKNVLTDLVKRTAACGKTSKMAIYKALKAHFKYETISKMPCHQFDEAEKILINLIVQFCD